MRESGAAQHQGDENSPRNRNDPESLTARSTTERMSVGSVPARSRSGVSGNESGVSVIVDGLRNMEPWSRFQHSSSEWGVPCCSRR